MHYSHSPDGSMGMGLGLGLVQTLSQTPQQGTDKTDDACEDNNTPAIITDTFPLLLIGLVSVYQLRPIVVLLHTSDVLLCLSATIPPHSNSRCPLVHSRWNEHGRGDMNKCPLVSQQCCSMADVGVWGEVNTLVVLWDLLKYLC